MSWYVLYCGLGKEQMIIDSCKQHLSKSALEAAFTFQCERLWRVNGSWKLIIKELFPGYVFLQSSHPNLLSGELDRYRAILRVLEHNGCLFSIYEEEEKFLKTLCGEQHCLKMSYGYKDQETGISYITDGPLIRWKDRIIKIDWHRRYARIEVSLSNKKSVIWAGVEVTEEIQSEGQQVKFPVKKMIS